jgi:hypothetical protein
MEWRAGMESLSPSTINVRLSAVRKLVGEARLRNIFRQPGDVTTVPEMLTSYRAVKQKLPELRNNAGGNSLFEAAVFEDIKVAALVESQKLIQARTRRVASSR